MKIFIDTEFNEMVDPVALISIGIVAENGREYYAVLDDWKDEDCNEFVKKHVIPNLASENRKPRHIVRAEILTFLEREKNPEWWGWFADYDMYLLSRLFGTFETRPDKIGFYCNDVRQFAEHVGTAQAFQLPKKLEPEHNALIDARWTKLAYEHVKACHDFQRGRT